MAHPNLLKTGFTRLVFRWCRLLYRKLRSGRIAVLAALTVLMLFTIGHFWSTYRVRKFGNSLLLVASTLRKRAPEDRCVHPKLDPYDPAVMQFFGKADPRDCSSAMTNWIYTSDGLFLISPDAIQQHGNITCQYVPLTRMGDFNFEAGTIIRHIRNGTPLTADFFSVFCESTDGEIYTNVHAAVARNATVMERLRDHHAQADGKGSAAQAEDPPSSHSLEKHNLSVFMLGFDSLSHMAWIRLLPKTRSYFLHTLGGTELESYNILGDGTPAALLPMLTGFTEAELPEARRGFTGATEIDAHPWIWREFSKRGYVTAYGEDMPFVGTFQYRMLGFKDQPTDHYMRPFHLMAAYHYPQNPLCFGSTTRHASFLNWYRDLFDMYKDFPKFLFGFQSEPTHKSNNQVQAVDDDLVAFLQALERKGHLNSTVLILMSDHGAKYDSARSTTQGRVEERMPYFSFRFPSWFYKLYPNITQNILTNINRLTTPHDIHATFHDILNYSASNEVDKESRGISLFREIPKERTCADSGVTTHWCACLPWKDVDPSNPLVLQAVDVAVQAINAFTRKRRLHCAELRVQGIIKSLRYVPSSGDLSAEGVLLNYPSEPYRPMVELYQVFFTTLPGQAHFEATLTRNLGTGEFNQMRAAKDISRVNTFGTQPACIWDDFPHLRSFCYCKP